MHNIVDLYSTILQGFILLLSGGIGTLHEDITSLVEGERQDKQTDIDISASLDRDQLAVDLEDDVVHDFAFSNC